MMIQDTFEAEDELENVEAANPVDPGILMPKTKDLYDVFLKKLATFLSYEGDALFIPKDLLSDEAIGNFLLELGEIHDYKPHFKKTALAAISYLFRVHLKESIFDFKHLYPNIHNSLSVIAVLIRLYILMCSCYCRNGETN